MAYLIETGKLAVIPPGARRLTALTYDETVMLDEHKEAQIKRNGGFADWLLEMRRDIFTYLRNNESYPLTTKQQKSA